MILHKKFLKRYVFFEYLLPFIIWG